MNTKELEPNGVTITTTIPTHMSNFKSVISIHSKNIRLSIVKKGLPY